MGGDLYGRHPDQGQTSAPQTSAAPSAASPRPVVERTEAGPDTDSATHATIQKMCEYIRAGVLDPEVRKAAFYARDHFTGGRLSPDMLAWAVFWYVKHCLRFRQDEAGLFRLGERDQQDLLIAPAVLVRMQDPAEDCDGFTMLTASLCAVLNIPVVIVTVAADPADPSRWSHVFAMAKLGDKLGARYMPLDASHGRYPGWMVPRRHITRWQCWALDGSPVDIPIPQLATGAMGLHGYVRRGRGMGDDATIDFPQNSSYPSVPLIDPSLIPYTPPIPDAPFGIPAPPPISAGGFNWNSFLNTVTADATGLIGKVIAPPAYQQVIRDANGNIISSTTVAAGASGAAAQPGAAFGMSPVVLIGLLVVVAFAVSGKK